MQVSNQREYAAMLKEIDTVKAGIASHEDFILKAMEELEELKPKIGSHEDHIREERDRVTTERAEVEQSVGEAEATIRRTGEERSRLEAELPPALVSAISRVESMRQGRFLVRADDGTCQACWVRVRPQVYQEIRLGSAVHQCGSCHRFLYVESAVETPSDAAETRPAPSGGVEAADGGAV